MSKYTFGLVAAVSNDKILEENLLKSSLIENDNIPLLQIRDATSASEAYNKGLKHFDGFDFIVFAHQDVYLPKNWYEDVANALDELNRMSENWAVLGVYGKTKQGEPIGRLWDSGMAIELGSPFNKPKEVDSVDELLIIINPKTPIRFDEKLPSFHLFGADICATARSIDCKCYAIHAPVVHNSKRISSLGGEYSRGYRYLQKKWRQELPLHAVCSKITYWGIQYYRIRFGLAYRRCLGLLPRRPAGLDDPISVAKRMGYE